jgi:hypothetical protein
MNSSLGTTLLRVLDKTEHVSVVQKPRKHSDDGCDGDGGRLGLLKILPGIVVVVVPVGPSDDGADEHVGVGRALAEVVEPALAGDLAGAGLDGRHRRAAVVHLRREPWPVPDHVAHPPGVGAEDVVRLRPREREEQRRRQRRAAAPERGARQVVGVRGGDERRRRDVLQVVPRLHPEHAAGAELGVDAMLHHVAEELLQAPLHHSRVAGVRQLPFEDKLQTRTIIIANYYFYVVTFEFYRADS